MSKKKLMKDIKKKKMKSKRSLQVVYNFYGCNLFCDLEIDKKII